jgi:DNA replication and repair protein RecF
VHLAHLSLVDFRSYAMVEVPLEPGVVVFTGPNGHGKTNLVEAVHYVATQGSHRVAADTPLVRLGAQRAVVRAEVVRDDRSALVELEINPGKSNRARVNRGALPRPKEALGLLRTVLFAPEDLALVKGDPAERRRFLDDLLVARTPRFAGVRADYDRVLRQRSTLLKTAGAARRQASGSGALGTLDVWDAHLARTGAALLEGRLELVAALRPLVDQAYACVALDRSADPTAAGAGISYKPSFELPDHVTGRGEISDLLLREVVDRRPEELDRGVCLVGPHRDDLLLTLGPLPAKGYASHGESWSLALALRLACYDLLRSEGDNPVLILDDVFAELDNERRARLAALVATADQVLVTAAVPEDVPQKLHGLHYEVYDGGVTRAD